MYQKNGSARGVSVPQALVTNSFRHCDNSLRPPFAHAATDVLLACRSARRANAPPDHVSCERGLGPPIPNPVSPACGAFAHLTLARHASDGPLRRTSPPACARGVGTASNGVVHSTWRSARLCHIPPMPRTTSSQCDPVDTRIRTHGRKTRQGVTMRGDGLPALTTDTAAPRFCRLTPGIARELVVRGSSAM